MHSTVNTSSLWGTVQRQMLKSKSVVKARVEPKRKGTELG